MEKSKMKKLIAGAMAAVLTAASVFVTPVGTKIVKAEVEGVTYTCGEWEGNTRTTTWDFSQSTTTKTVIAEDVKIGNADGVNISGTGLTVTKASYMEVAAATGVINIAVDAATTSATVNVTSTRKDTAVTLECGSETFSFSDAAKLTATFTVDTITDGKIVITNSGTNAARVQSIELIETKESSGPTPPAGGVYAQYKATGDTYTLRIVYEVPYSTVEGKQAIGVQYNGAVKENLTGTNVYSSLKANGETVTAKDGSCYVIVEITDVPADASFSIQPIVVEEEGNTVLGDNAYTVTMSELVK